MALETAPAKTVKVSPRVSQLLMKFSDTVFAAIPQQRPAESAFKACKLVGHRGCKDHAGILENTFEAYDHALAEGMDGIELDLRWTKDQELVVAHDPDLMRVHGLPHRIAELSAKELRALCPAVPLFSEVVSKYRGKLQLYIELKKDDWHNVAAQQEKLKAALAQLHPKDDYYLMSFDLDLLGALSAFEPSSKIAIMHSNPSDIKQLVAAKQVGIVGGHYLLLTDKFRNHCQQHGVDIGVGFPASRNSLWREIKRGAHFAFVDNPSTAKLWR